MNPNLAKLQPYPFEELRALNAGIEPNAALSPINLSIGETKHPTPEFIKRAIGQSTRILNRASGEIIYGRIPDGSVVVPGTLASGDGRYGLYCAIIVKQVDAKTRFKTSINELLRRE